MTEYKLYYFDVRNLAEPIRVMLHYNGADFEDIRVDMEKWPSMKSGMFHSKGQLQWKVNMIVQKCHNTPSLCWK